MATSYSIEQAENSLLLHLSGSLTAREAVAFRRCTEEVSLLMSKQERPLRVDCSQVGEFDSYAAVFIAELRLLSSDFRLVAVPKQMESLLNLYLDFAPQAVGSKVVSAASKIGIAEKLVVSVERAGANTMRQLSQFLSFVGEVTIGLILSLLQFKKIRWQDVPFLLRRAGVGGVGIVFLIGTLVGVIIGYQGALQLKKFGGDMFLAQLVNISIVRELGPLMTAIIVAGRSGAAYAAEIGTMKVGEEVDALLSMGLHPIRFLVIPRVIATVVAIPFLTLLACVAGMAGGMMTGVATLDLTYTGYLLETQRTLAYEDLALGISKSLLFGYIIALVGCYKGLQARGGAESVGLFTTSAVVASIFLIVLSNALLAFIVQIFSI